MSAPRAARGEVWLADLDAGHGREQAGVRPVLVVSATELGSGPSGLAIVVPLTTTHRPTQPQRRMRRVRETARICSVIA